MSSARTEQRRLVAIMFTDMAGYGGLAQRNEVLAREFLEEYRRLLRGRFAAFHGKEIESLGQGFQAAFASALEAARCAISIQRTLAMRNTSAPRARRIWVRIGIQLGCVADAEPDATGDPPQPTSRLVRLAKPGGICVSADVAREIQPHLQATLVKVEPAELSHLEAPIEACRIVLPWEKSRRGRRSGKTASGHRRHSKPAVPQTNRHRRAALFTALVLVMLALALPLASRWFTRPVASTLRLTTIAVRPTEDRSADARLTPLSLGMTETLCTALGGIRALRVPGRAAVMRYQGSTQSLAGMARELNVDAVVGSAIRQERNRLRLHVQLVQGDPERELWTKDYDCDLGDLFKVQSEVARAIAAVIHAPLTVEDQARLARARTAHPGVVEACLEGRYQLLTSTPEGLTNAIRAYQRAIQIDPTFAPAFVGLATGYATSLSGLGYDRDTATRSGEAMRAAVRLDPDDPEAHYALGMSAWLVEWDWARAEVAFQRAIDLRPIEPLYRAGYAMGLTSMGRFDLALRQIGQAIESDPWSIPFQVQRATVFASMRRYDVAIAQLRDVLRLAPDTADAQALLGGCYLESSRTQEAVQAFQKAVQLVPGEPAYRGYLGYASGVAGRRDEALKQLEVLERLSQRRLVWPSARAIVHLGLGHTDEALAWLEKAQEARDPSLVWLKVEATYDRLRGTARYQELLAKVGLANHPPTSAPTF